MCSRWWRNVIGAFVPDGEPLRAAQRQPRAERARHGAGRGVASAADAPLSPERADLPQGYAAGAEGQRMTGGAAAGVGPWKPLCFPFARGRQLLRRR